MKVMLYGSNSSYIMEYRVVTASRFKVYRGSCFTVKSCHTTTCYALWLKSPHSHKYRVATPSTHLGLGTMDGYALLLKLSHLMKYRVATRFVFRVYRGLSFMG